MKKNLHIHKFIISILFIFGLIYYPAYHIPFQSDDYGYFLMGNSWENHIKHYMSWSGRFITDYTSSFILNAFSKPIYMAINSLVLLIVLVCITFLPKIINRQPLMTQNSWLSLWLIFIIYWCANPNLGQTTFWFVGSTNYLWTLMWISLYFCYLFSLLAKEQPFNPKKSVLLILLAFLAGFSGEVQGASAVFLTIILLFIYRNQRKTLITAFLPVLIGFAFLYFAPGNSIRMHHPLFSDWVNRSTYIKVYIHLFDRIPDIFNRLWLVSILIILFSTIIYFNNSQKLIDKSLLIFAVILIFSSIILVKAPHIPPRSMNSQLYFMLIILSILMNSIPPISWKNQIFIKLIIGLNSILFAYSYILFAYAINRTAIQA